MIIPSLKLAKLDTIYRLGIIPKDLESKEVDKNIMDLRNLISIVDSNLFKAKKMGGCKIQCW